MMDAIRDGLSLPDFANNQPSDLLRRLHLTVEPIWNTTFVFATALAVLIEPVTGQMSAANAGQPQPISGRPGVEWQNWPLAGGVPLGLPLPGSPDPQAVAVLSTGEFVLLFTDGVSDAGAPSSLPAFHQIAFDPALGAVTASATPAQLVSAVVTSLQQHVGITWPDDDTTIACCRRI